MIEIISISNDRFLVDFIEHKEEGVIFLNNSEFAFLPHKKIKSIDVNYISSSTKNSIKKKKKTKQLLLN
jgi:hypothetical protein